MNLILLSRVINAYHRNLGKREPYSRRTGEQVTTSRTTLEQWIIKSQPKQIEKAKREILYFVINQLLGDCTFIVSNIIDILNIIDLLAKE